MSIDMNVPGLLIRQVTSGLIAKLSLFEIPLVDMEYCCLLLQDECRCKMYCHIHIEVGIKNILSLIVSSYN